MFNYLVSAASNGKGGAISAFGSMINEMIELSLNTDHWLSDINRRAVKLANEKQLSEIEAEQAFLELEAQRRRSDIIALEKYFLDYKLQLAEGDNFRNPEIWYKVAEMQMRLFFSSMGRAILSCWRVQKAIEFEIEVGLKPFPVISPTTGEHTEWRPIRFDYLDQVIMGGGGHVEASPLIAAIIGPDCMQEDFENLKDYHRIWNEIHIPHFEGVEISFRDHFSNQLAQIKTATGRQIRVHFTTDIKLFDLLRPGFPVYGRIFYVQVFYDSDSNVDDFTGYLTNAHEIEITPGRLIRSNLTYWRVPDDRGTSGAVRCNPELNDARYLHDWIDYSGSSEKWILKAKPAAPSGSEANIVSIYNITSPMGIEVAERTKEYYSDFLYTFENTGIYSDWTLFLQIPPGSLVQWSDINDIKLKVVYKATARSVVTSLSTNQLYADPVGHTYVRRFRESPEHEYFENIFDPLNQYTDQIGLQNNQIVFIIVPDGTLPGQDRRITSVSLGFLFNEHVIAQADFPSLTARLTKSGVVDVTGQPVEIVFTSPTAIESPPFELPVMFLNQDPAGAWAFKMVINDNLDEDGKAKSLRGLIDIILILEYKYRIENP
jgi:hypothetical protein